MIGSNAAIALIALMLTQIDAPDAEPVDPAPLEAEADTRSGAGGLDEILSRLANAEDASEAARLESDAYAAWFDAGGPTVDILMERGVQAQTQGDLDLARDMYDRVILVDPDYVEVWNRRSSIFYAEGRYDEAIADLQETLSREPRHFGAWIGLGVIFEALDERAAALAAYREALEIHPFAGRAEQGAARLAPIVEGRAL
ncbi:MAG: tetratricopeptide repeat protein [Pseudomonadota bacterium]